MKAQIAQRYVEFDLDLAPLILKLLAVLDEVLLELLILLNDEQI